MTDYSYLDKLSDDEVQAFKDAAREAELAGIAHAFAMDAVGMGRLIAEGDSWFDYFPGTDLIDCLRRHHGYRIKNFADAGDTLENMIYGTRYDRDFNQTAPTIELVLKYIEEAKPRIFLFSGGGNDVAGDEFENYLNHSHSGLPSLRQDFTEYMVGTVFNQYFRDLAERVKLVSPETKIIVHGYGHTRPTGKAVRFLFFKFTGPWLRPALVKKRIFDVDEQMSLVTALIDRYNTLLQELDHQVDNIVYVDLRDHIDPDHDWANELHLKNSAFARAADVVHETIQSLLP